MWNPRQQSAFVQRPIEYLHMFTPRGIVVPGLRDTNEEWLWAKYAKIMDMPRYELERLGYRVDRLNLRRR